MKTKFPTINVPERGTIAAMKWIAENGCPYLHQTVISYDGIPYLIVSSETEENIRALLEEHPVSAWHDINGMKRLAHPLDSYPCWYFYINGHYYFVSIW